MKILVALIITLIICLSPTITSSADYRKGMPSHARESIRQERLLDRVRDLEGVIEKQNLLISRQSEKIKLLERELANFKESK